MWKRLVRFFRYVVLGTIGASALLALAGCAVPPPPELPKQEAQRYLSPQQDEEIGRACATGCAILPRDLYLDMLRRQQQMGV